jgi:hypothetical protein
MMGVIRDIPLLRDIIVRNEDVKQRNSSPESVRIKSQSRDVLIVSNISTDQSLTMRQRHRGYENIHSTRKLTNSSQMRKDRRIQVHRPRIEFKDFELGQSVEELRPLATRVCNELQSHERLRYVEPGR